MQLSNGAAIKRLTADRLAAQTRCGSVAEEAVKLAEEAAAKAEAVNAAAAAKEALEASANSQSPGVREPQQVGGSIRDE